MRFIPAFFVYEGYAQITGRNSDASPKETFNVALLRARRLIHSIVVSRLIYFNFKFQLVGAEQNRAKNYAGQLT